MGEVMQVQAKGATVQPGDGAAVLLPSGLTVTLIEVIWNSPGPGGDAARFRFLAPEIGAVAPAPDVMQADMLALCRGFALGQLATAPGAQPSQVIISLSDRPLPFGQSDPEARQYFEAYLLTDGDCEWSLF